MGADELVAWLTAIGLSDTVAVGTETERTWCLRPVPGDDGWEVFWCEHGGRFAWTRFDDEFAACVHLFGRLAWAQVVRGALVPSSTGAARTPPGAASGAET